MTARVEDAVRRLERSLRDLEDVGGLTREYAIALRAAMAKVTAMERKALRMVRKGMTPAEIIAMTRVECDAAAKIIGDFEARHGILPTMLH